MVFQTKWLRDNRLNLVGLTVLYLLIIVPRLLPVPPLFLTFDEVELGQWINQMTQGLLAGEWQDTAKNIYPAVTFAWLEVAQVEVAQLLPGQSATVAQMLSDTDEAVFASLPRRRMVLAGVNSLLIIAIFGLLRRIYRDFVAVSAALLMALDPFLLTQSRVYRPEGLTTGLMMLTILSLISYVKERRLRWLIVSAILGGWAALTKITALYLLPFVGLALLFWPFWQQEAKNWELLKRLGRDMLLWSLIMGGTFFVFWPVLWVSPAVAFDLLYSYVQSAATDVFIVWRTDGVFFQGKVVKGDPGLAFYGWALAYRTIPPLWLGLASALGGMVALFLQRLKLFRLPRPLPLFEQDMGPNLLILAFALSYFGAISLGVSKVDRYLYPIFPALSILAASGFLLITELLGAREPLLRPIKGGIWAGLLVAGLWLTLSHYPYYFTYWNPLLGGGRAAAQTLPVGSGEGLDVLVEYLNTLPGAQESNLVGPSIPNFCYATFKGHCLEESEFLASDYFISYILALQNETAIADIQALVPDAELIKTYTKEGVDYARLYRMPEGLQSTRQLLGDHGQFKGFRLSATTAGAGDPLEVTIFWLNGEQGWTIEDSEFFVKVVDRSGQVQQLAPAHLKPEFAASQAQPGELLVFTAPFQLSPDLAPDIYHLEIGLRLKATATETWNFSMAGLANTLTLNRGVLKLPAEALPIQYRVNEAIGETGLVFLGYNDLKLGEIPRVELYWQAKQALTEDYWVDLTLLDGNDQVLATWRRPLSSELHPLPTWQPGEIVKVSFPLELTQKLPAGPYRPVLSVLPADPSTGPVAQVNLFLN